MSITIKPRTTEVVLFQGDDLDPIETLRAKVEEAALVSDGTSRRLNDDPVLSAAQEYDAFVDAAIERAVKVTLQALGRKQYRGLVEKHPPRPENEGDKEWGFNSDTFGDDLVPACIADGQFESARDMDAFLDDLSDGDWSRLVSAALMLNQGSGPDPKARLSSRVAQTSDAT